MVRQGHLIAVVGTFLIGCVVLLLLAVGCAGTRSETSKKEQEPTQATKEERTRSPEATASVETTASEEATTAFEDFQREDVLKAPPQSTLSYGGREVRSSEYFVHSWTYKGYVYEDMIDSIISTPPRKQALLVPSGSEMVFRYEAPRPPNKVSAMAYPVIAAEPGTANVQPWGPGRSLKAHSSGVERTIPVELQPRPRGYAVIVAVKDPQGRVSYAFRVMVR